MKLLKCQIKNFASYDNLEFDYSNRGLSLIYGATGSGKSTIPDISAWILYGITAKDGNVDEVRSWQSPEKPTEGTLFLEVKGKEISITRIRGKASENDLYWTDSTGIHRGKDIIDTQKLVDGWLGVTSQVYLMGAYFSEFSPSSQFFVAKAKDRRTIFESVADLELSVKLLERIKSEKKTTKDVYEERKRLFDKSIGRAELLASTKESCQSAGCDWASKREGKLQELKIKSKSFKEEKASKIEVLKTKRDAFESNIVSKVQSIESKIPKLEAKIKSLTGKKCPTCGLSDNDSELEVLKLKLEQLRKEQLSLIEQINPYDQQIEQAALLENPYKAQIEEKLAEINPYESQLSTIAREIVQLEGKTLEIAVELDKLSLRLNQLDLLNDLSYKLRGKVINNTIKFIESETNRRLESYYDSEFRVCFTVDKIDSIDVQIFKNGYECVYKQLSKGQRQILKLCFSASIMSAAENRSGVHFDVLFFDEALDGLDTNLKIKSFSLFNELANNKNSVFVIEHSPEFQNLFDNKLKVSMENDMSAIEDLHE